MLRILVRWLSPLLLGVLLALPSHAQFSKKDGTSGDTRSKDESAPSSHVPVFEFCLALGGTALILFILCMPSRKR